MKNSKEGSTGGCTGEQLNDSVESYESVLGSSAEHICILRPDLSGAGKGAARAAAEFERRARSEEARERREYLREQDVNIAKREHRLLREREVAEIKDRAAAQALIKEESAAISYWSFHIIC